MHVNRGMFILTSMFIFTETKSRSEEKFSMQLNVGDIVEGKVTGLTDFGAFVKVTSGEVGMVHISEVASSYVKDIKEHLAEGQEVKVKVLAVNETGKISLSIKQAAPKPAESREKREFKGDRGFDRKPGAGKPRRNNNPPVWQGNRQEEKPQSFEDMMAKFKQTSDERQAGMKKPAESRRSGGGARRGGNNKW